MSNSLKRAIHSCAVFATIAIPFFARGYAETHDALALSIDQPPPANDPVSVLISPFSAQVTTGSQLQFSVIVSGTQNKSVSWTIVGTGCAGSSCGTITSSGLYIAPSTIPSPPVALITATSQDDPTKSSTAVVTIIAPIQVSVRPAKAEILVGGHQQFTAIVSGTTDTVVLWSVRGVGCAGSDCGTISKSGLYTAPPVAPKPPLVTVTATSAADPSKSGSAVVTVTGPVSISISPKTSSAVVGSSQQFSATIKGTFDSRASWSVIGTGCSGADCGTVSPEGLYFAPPAIPSPAQVFVSVTSVIDPTKSASAAVTILPPLSVTITPSIATVVTGTQLQFTATVKGYANQNVIWSLSGTGCSGTTCGQISSAGLYTAPSVLPAQPKVTVKAAAAVYPNVYRISTVTIVPPIKVTVSPPAASLVVDTSTRFNATVSGSSDQDVTWSISGAGCSGTSCGTITPKGMYTAPAAVPSPSVITVTATSTLNTSVSGSAFITILPPVGIQVSPAGAEVVTGRQQQFTASVTGTTNKTVAWSVSGAGCAGIACGSVTSTGLYSAPNSVPQPRQVIVKATSSADNTKSSFSTVTIISPVDITIVPTSAVVALSTQVRFRTNVIGSADEQVVWSLSGVGCSGSSCGTIDAGLYTAPSAIPPFAVVIVTATSHIDPSRSASAIVSIVGSNDAKLTGSFVFHLSGFDASGVNDSAGILRADGKGNIVAGMEDVNRAAGPSVGVPLTGQYSIGSDNRGVLVLNNGNEEQTFRFALNQAATKARCIEFDNSGVLASGEFMQQDPSGLSLSALKGGYAVSLVGQDRSGARIGALGMLYLDDVGNIAGGIMDVNDNGNVLPTFASLSGSVAVDGSGHGSIHLNVPGLLRGQFQFGFYLASSDQFFLVSTDTAPSGNPIFAGRAMRQEGFPYSQSSLMRGTIFSLSGGNSTAPEVLVGRISFDGISAPWARFDENVAGAVKTGNVLTGAYTVGLNGVGILNLDAADGSTRDFVAYLYGPDRAFLMDVSTSAVDMGELVPQVERSPYTTQDLLSRYLLGSGDPSGSMASLYSGTIDFDGRNAGKGKADIDQSGSLSSGQVLDGSYRITSPMFGRASVDLTSPSNSHIVLWMVGPDEAVGFAANASVTQPVILHFEQ